MEEKKFVEQEAKEEVRKLTEPEMEKVVGGANLADIERGFKSDSPAFPENTNLTNGAQSMLSQAEQTLNSVSNLL